MTPKDAPRSWFGTVVGSVLCLGGLALHFGLPGRSTEGLTIVAIVIGAALIDGSRITNVVKARFSKSDP